MIYELKRVSKDNRGLPHKQIILDLYNIQYGVSISIEVTVLAMQKDIDRACRELTRKGLRGLYLTVDEWLNVTLKEVTNI